jgi:hypothetical protein
MSNGVTKRWDSLKEIGEVNNGWNGEYLIRLILTLPNYNLILKELLAKRSIKNINS